MTDKQTATPHSQAPQPIKPKHLTWLLMAVIVILAFAAAYYQTALKLEKKKYKRLEDKYVRVRNMLGANKMKQLIEDSYQDNQGGSE
jgi:hypothetical protein